MSPRQNRKKPDVRIAVAYLRVSTSEQHLGPEAQRVAIEGWATREGVTVVGWHADHGVSGGSNVDQRPGLLACLEHVRADGAGVLVVAKRDRLARDVYIAAGVERHVARLGACVVSADGVGNGDSPADQFMRTVIDGAAAYERALIRARTRAALQIKVIRGESTGVPPYGSRVGADGKTLEVDPSEQHTLTEIAVLRARGLSYRKIRTQLTERGLLGRTRRPFTLAAIYAMASTSTLSSPSKPSSP